MNVEILDVKVSPYLKYTWDSDKKKNRWATVNGTPFRYRVHVKLKIDGKVIETYKDTKHFKISRGDAVSGIFAKAILGELGQD